MQHNHLERLKRKKPLYPRLKLLGYKGSCYNASEVT